MFSARSTNPKEVQKALKISVNYAIDSDEGESEIAPFKNILNEMYAEIIQKNSFIPQAQRQYGRAVITTALRIYEITGKQKEMDNLTSPLLRELIDHIDIFETEGTGKSRTQRIVIYYRFIGYIELPNTTKQTHIADTRKGVAVEYITEQFTA